MTTLTRRQSRQIDSIAIDRCGIPGMVLMENAGRGVVEVLLGIDPGLADVSAGRVVIVCGKGNNAGDGFVVARHLEIRGVPARVVLLASPAELRGDALANYEILCHTEVPIVGVASESDMRVALDAEAAGAKWIVDAILGTGARGEPRKPFATAIDWMNAQPARRLAIDVPSGLDCDTGQPAATTVRAEHTCTFVTAKTGFATSSARDFLGQVHVVSIGIPPQLIDEVVRGAIPGTS